MTPNGAVFLPVMGDTRMGSVGVRHAVLLAVVILLALIGMVSMGLAASGREPAAAPAARLDAAVHASWTGLPLREWAARMTTLAGLPIILDRRIDPMRPVTLTGRGETVGTVLDRVAAETGATVDEVGSTIWLVPLDRTGQAARAAADRQLRMAKLPPPLRRTLTATAPLTWPAGARPGDLVDRLATAARLALDGLDTIPHDHLPANALPSLSLAERLDLVLAQVDRRIVWTDRGGRIVAIDMEVSTEVSAAPVSAGAGPARRPEPGRGADERAGGGRTAAGRASKSRDEYTLRLEAPLEEALAALARQLDLDVDLDVASLTAHGIAPGEIVRADVTGVSRDALFDAILQPVGLSWRVEGRTLRVFAGGDEVVTAK
jgi:hypothetical protein